MREYPLNNFNITYSREADRPQVRKWVRLTAPPEVREELQARLTHEYLALGLAGMYCPELVPEIYHDVPNPDTSTSISMERLAEVPDVSLAEVINVVEQLQNKIPSPGVGTRQESGLPVYDTNNYLSILETNVLRLQNFDATDGMSDLEARAVMQKALPNLGAIGVFDTVFVHTDVQRRHFGRSADGKLKIFDFDQGHFGNELEDFAFLGMRHPEWAAAIREHLLVKFAHEPEKLANLDDGLAFLQITF